MVNKITIIPNKLFYANQNEISIYKMCNNHKVLLILYYLYNITDREGISRMTIEDIVVTYGYKLNNHKGKINEQIKNILHILQQNKIINSNKDVSKITINEFVKFTYNGIEKDDNGNYTRFSMIDNDIVNKLLSYNKTKVDNVLLLFYYCYINSRIYKSSDSHGKGYICGGKAEECHPSYNMIADDIGIKDDTIKKYNEILVEMNLIRIGNLGLCYLNGDKGKIRESPNFYVLIEGEFTDNENAIWKWNLKEGMKAYKKNNPNLVFLNTREYKDNNKKINGYIARINQLEKEGKATKRQINKRDKLMNERENNYNQIK